LRFKLHGVQVVAPDVVEQVDKAEKIFIPVIVAGELYYGTIKSQFSKRNLDNI